MMRQVEPFLAIKPSTMVKRHEKLQFDEEFWMQDKTFTVELKGHGKHIESHGPMKMWNDGERTDQMLLLLKNIAKHLPSMNVTFTGHDVPWVRCFSPSSPDLHADVSFTGRLIRRESSTASCGCEVWTACVLLFVLPGIAS